MKFAEPYIMGIASSHNGGVCLLKGHTIVAAVQEERLRRQKRAECPGAQASLAIQYCLDAGGIKASDLELVVLCSAQDNTRQLDDVGLNPLLRVVHNQVSTLAVSHHLAHAVGAFVSSGFEHSAILVVDGHGSRIGDLTSAEREVMLNCPVPRPEGDEDIRETVSLYSASGSSVTPLEKRGYPVRASILRDAPFSLGRMYEDIARQIFGERLDGVGKLMGLAPYGSATIGQERFYTIVDGQPVFHNLVAHFSGLAPWPESKTVYQDLAMSTQRALESAIMELVSRLSQLSGEANLCYAGGVALNSVANEKICRFGPFESVYIMPAAEDSGTAVGAAYYGLWKLTGNLARRRTGRDATGRSYSSEQIESAVSAPSVPT